MVVQKNYNTSPFREHPV